MYVPAERNFISMVNKPNLIKDLPDALLVFLTEYNNAKQLIKGSLELPINHAQLEYNKQKRHCLCQRRGLQSEADGGFQWLPVHSTALSGFSAFVRICKKPGKQCPKDE